MRSVLVFIIAFAFVSAAKAELGALDKMVMPGEVIQDHSKFESSCSKCHVVFRKNAQDKACVQCHDHVDIGRDVKNKKGFHGRIKGKFCRDCHKEHLGRSADIIRFDERKFNHRQTDFPLGGKHRKTKCKECHKAGEKYSQAPSDCYTCHRLDDKHKGGLGKDCGKCHVDQSWDKIRFDHDKTGFKLRGKHAKAKCESCHKKHRYKDTPDTCYACHRKDDKHKGGLGRKCQKCHVAGSWKRMKFNHDKTGFPLRGEHKKAECESCHKKHNYKDAPTSCYACHKRDDKHKGEQGKKCESCHNEYLWKRTSFDHGLSTFPLLGKHKKVKCKKCHKSKRFKKAPTDCYSCHRRKDEHKGTLGTKCDICHNSKDWKYWKFNHNRQTGFRLDGAHKNLACVTCHNRPVKGRALLPGTCVDCHSGDDVHDGRFGEYCERCHTTTDFRDVRHGIR